MNVWPLHCESKKRHTSAHLLLNFNSFFKKKRKAALYGLNVICRNLTTLMFVVFQRADPLSEVVHGSLCRGGQTGPHTGSNEGKNH